MTLTITNVENWKPDLLATAGNSAQHLSKDLDDRVVAINSQIAGFKWDGAAAKAANDRMDIEKNRVSTASGAIHGLQAAFGQQVENLKNTRQRILDLRNQARNMPAPMGPFEVADSGLVTAQGRIKWVEATFHDPDPRLAMWRTLELAEAARRSVEMMQALQQAEKIAGDAINTVKQAKNAVDAAYNTLGDPNLGAPTKPATPAPTTPASVASPTNGSTGAQDTSYTGSSTGGDQTYSGPTSGGPPLAQPSGDVKQWIEQARQILIAEGVPPNEIDDEALAVIIQGESGGNPHAINNLDSNAAAGHPSKGLMQTIDSTFNSYAAPGHTDIWNPVDNIVAGARYSLARYGTMRHPGVVSYLAGNGYHGY